MGGEHLGPARASGLRIRGCRLRGGAYPAVDTRIIIGRRDTVRRRGHNLAVGHVELGITFVHGVLFDLGLRPRTPRAMGFTGYGRRGGDGGPGAVSMHGGGKSHTQRDSGGGQNESIHWGPFGVDISIPDYAAIWAFAIAAVTAQSTTHVGTVSRRQGSGRPFCRICRTPGNTLPAVCRTATSIIHTEFDCYPTPVVVVLLLVLLLGLSEIPLGSVMPHTCYAPHLAASEGLTPAPHQYELPPAHPGKPCRIVAFSSPGA